MKRLLITLLLAGCAFHGGAAPPAPVNPASATRHLSSVQHIVIIMMENRSFDSYFGTFPGVNGIPKNPSCNPDPISGQCVYPYHDTTLINYGGPHDPGAVTSDIDGGKLDGFIVNAEKVPHFLDPNPDDVMGYHTCAELPVYCGYANTYTLADNHFAATTSWSTMAHLYMVSGWSATCRKPGNPMSCFSNNAVNAKSIPPPDYAWTDITWLLHAHGISWGYYVSPKSLEMVADQGDGENPNTSGPSFWNPLPGFDDVRIDGETANIQQDSNFTAHAAAGTLPAVSWVMPPFDSSDHPTASIAKGQAWVQKQVNAVMNGHDWSSTVILLSWDEFGGFYDHVLPQFVDSQGYGFRTPLILIGPMVKHGIDHQFLSSDAYLKFIEDTFLGSARLDANDGRKDSRPDVRENTTGLGDLRNDLN